VILVVYGGVSTSVHLRDWIKRVKGLVLLDKSLDLVYHVLSPLAVHILGLGILEDVIFVQPLIPRVVSGRLLVHVLG